ncbi:MAG: nuclear transport factor 2 family protein [Alphaproteobacteria bacterium]|nr:nuclear transport factor 2 family protein [Alphaproteobacteria bacterium]
MSVSQNVAQAAAPANEYAIEKEIVALIHRVARYSDEKKFLEWMDLFAENAVYGGITSENYGETGLYLFRDKGKGALHERVAFLKGLWQVPRGKTLHLITNIEIEIDPSGLAASANSYFLMTRTGEMEHSKLHACGRYFDKFVFVDGAWLVGERTVVVDSNMLPGEFTDLL